MCCNYLLYITFFNRISDYCFRKKNSTNIDLLIYDFYIYHEILPFRTRYGVHPVPHAHSLCYICRISLPVQCLWKLLNKSTCLFSTHQADIQVLINHWQHGSANTGLQGFEINDGEQERVWNNWRCWGTTEICWEETKRTRIRYRGNSWFMEEKPQWKRWLHEEPEAKKERKQTLPKQSDWVGKGIIQVQLTLNLT